MRLPRRPVTEGWCEECGAWVRFAQHAEWHADLLRVLNGLSRPVVSAAEVTGTQLMSRADLAKELEAE